MDTFFVTTSLLKILGILFLVILPMVSWAARRAVQGSGNALAVIPPGAAALRAALQESGCEILESSWARRARLERAASAYSLRSAAIAVDVGDEVGS